MGDALTLLHLLADWGADEALEEQPVDRLAAAASPQPGPRLLAAGGRAAIAVADTLAELRAAIIGFEGTALRATATAPVLFEGDAAAGLILIGPPPGADDDRAGHAMAGEAGAFLDAMLASIGLAREGLLLTPLIPWRPPGDRPPSPAEIGACLPFLHRLINLTRPRLALLFGPLAARVLLGGDRRPPRGRFTDVTIPALDAPLSCLPMAGPAQLLANPQADLRRAAWADLRLLRRRLDDSPTQK